MERKSYSDKLAFAAAQNIKEKEYWLEKLSGELAKGCFPYDNPGGVREPVICTFEFKLEGSLADKLAGLSKGNHNREYMVLAAAVMTLLNIYTGNKDIIVGMSVLRQETEIQYINTVLALRTQLDHDNTFRDVLRQLGKSIFEAMEHQNYPLEILLDQLNLEFTPGSFPLFDVTVLLENIHDKNFISHLPTNVNFFFNRKENEVEGRVEYNGSRYGEASVRRIISHFTNLLEQVLGDVDISLNQIDVLSPGERHQLLVDYNDTDAPYPRNDTIHRLFERQARETPDNTAVVFENQKLTYAQLNAKANRLARWLRKTYLRKRHQPGSPDSLGIVGLMMDNSLEMIVGLLAILKAGGCYLPINPQYPQKRIQQVLNDSNAMILLTRESTMEGLEFAELQVTPDTSYHARHNLSVTPVRPQIMDLDTLQVPDRSLVNYEKYHPYIGQSMVKNSITVQFSRGCVYKCVYCFKIWPDRYAHRSGESLFEEVHTYYKMGIRRFGFTDDLPNFKKEEIAKFYRLIIKHGLKLHLHFPNGIRGDILSKEHIDLMVEAGAVTMDLALETASPRLQKLIKKNVNIERLRENVQYIIDNYPHVILGVQIMHGFPGETEEEARSSLDFIKSFRWLPFGYMHVLKIYPNTAMARLAMEHGISEEAIVKAASLGYHELPDTLPFSRTFTRQCQSEYLSEFFLLKERLLKVLPHQMSRLTEDELVQKYNSYLPEQIRSFDDLLRYVDIDRSEIKGEFLPDDFGKVENFNGKLREYFPVHKSEETAFRVLLLDLSQAFSSECEDVYSVVDPPLGPMYLLTHLHKHFGGRIKGRIAKSMIDFDSYGELRELIAEFKPDLIGVRTLTFFKDFFHKSIMLLRQWGVDVPVVAGGPYATSSYHTMLRDVNVDAAVLGEGEATLVELVERMMSNGRCFPSEEDLEQIKGMAFLPSPPTASLRRMNREIVLYDRLDDVISQESSEDIPFEGNAQDPAYVIYTSGSTGIPKGVLIHHNNFVNQVVGLRERFSTDMSDNYLMLASFTFDVSLMHIFWSLTTGSSLYLVREELKKDPIRLWDFIHHNKISVLNIVPAFMKAILENIENRKIAFRYLFVGGDVFDMELYKSLVETFDVGQLLNIYGPTETTVNALLYRCPLDGFEEGTASIPIGRPLGNYRVYVLDEGLRLVPPGVRGELCISGAGVSRGYLNRPEACAEKFVPHPYIEGEALYRSGDYGRWLPGGDIEFLGRKDAQVKVRGFRIELGEIERRLSVLDGVLESVVLARRDREGDRYLCGYVVLEEGVEASGLKERLKEELPDYMVPSHLVCMEELPLTASGKVDRAALERYDERVGGTYTAPRHRMEHQLVGLWSDILGMDAEEISIDGNFFELGGHSLRATILISRIHKLFNVKVGLSQVFQYPSIRTLAEYLEGCVEDIYRSILPVEKRPYYRLSAAQKRMYILNRMENDTINYNVPAAFELGGELDVEELESAFRSLIRRHESLRTSFLMVDGQPMQQVHNADEVDFEIEYSETDKELPPGLLEEFVQPFDLGRVPLFRVRAIRLATDRCILMIDIHHIIFDGVSKEVFIKELMALYAGVELPGLSLQYKDFSEWQNKILDSDDIKRQESFWLEVFSGDLPVLNIPTDYPRPESQSFEGSSVEFELGESETRRLREICFREDVTLYMILLAVYSILLSKLSRQEDIVVGTPIAGRVHDDLKRIIGMFVNTLAQRTYPRGDKSFREYLREVREHTLKSFENQEYQFEDLVDRLALERDSARNPLFDAMFAVQNVELQAGLLPEVTLSGITSLKYLNIKTVTQLDLNLHSLDMGEKIAFIFEYSTKLFSKNTIENFVEYFQEIIKAILEDIEVPLKNIKISHQLVSVEPRKSSIEFGFESL